MYPTKKQGKSKLSQSMQDTIVQNILQIFPRGVTREFVRNALVKENWDLEKSLRVIHAATNSKKNSKGFNNTQKKEKSSGQGNVGARAQYASKGSNNKPELFQKGPQGKTVRQKPHRATPDGWVMVDRPSKVVNETKSKQKKVPKTNPSKEDMMKTVTFQDEKPSSSTATRQARRTQLINNYNIIKHFGEASTRISSYIREGIKVMVLMRGCSGSGKSTYANQLLLKAGAKHPEFHIFSTDTYFIRADGRYCFNVNLLSDAHVWNQKLVKLAGAEGRSPIIVDNTNTQLWEMREYAMIAVSNGYVLETLEPPTPWFFNENILYRRTQHSIPKERIRNMLDRYEANLSGEDVIRHLNLSYSPPMVPPLGAIAGLDFPISKNHAKMLSIPSGKYVAPLNEISYSPPIKTSPKIQNQSSQANFYFGQPEMTALSSSLSGMSIVNSFQLPPPKTESVVGNLISVEDSSPESGESDSEGMCETSDSESDEDNLVESDTIISDTESDNVLNLEYVLISENTIIFQKDHPEMKDIKTLEEFRCIPTNVSKLTDDFEDYLNKFLESAVFNVQNDSAVCGPGGDVLETEEPSPTNSSENLEDPQNPLYPTLDTLKNEVKNVDHSNTFGEGDMRRDQNLNEIDVLEEDEVSSGQIGASSVSDENKPIETLHLLFPQVSKDKLLELFGTSLEDIDWAISILLDSGQKMAELGEADPVQNPSELTVTTAEIHCENMKLPNQEIPDFSPSTSFSDPKTPQKSSTYVGDWDFKKEAPKELPREVPKIQRTPTLRKNTKGLDIATNTNYADFEILRKVNNDCLDLFSNVKILIGNPFFICGQALFPFLPSVSMLDKGTMTCDIETNHVDQFDSGIERLSAMFPRVARDNLEELFEKCQKDIDWAAGLLLDSGQEMSELFTSLEPIESCSQTLLNEPSSTVSVENKKSYEPTASENLSNVESKTKKKKKIRHSKSDNDVHKEIQDQIQNNFVLDDSYYTSERMKKHFQRKYGNKNIVESSLEETANVQSEEKNDESNDDRTDSDPEEDVVFMMDRDFIFQLQSRFGGLLRPNMIGEKTVVKLPLSLARQLHSYVMDSVHEHIEEEDVFTDEDEEYARHLQEEELRAQGTPSLLQIMDEEVALRKSQKELGNGRSMASALSKQLLIERFPKMDPATLAMILEDTNHSLHQATCLLSSAGHHQAAQDGAQLARAKKSEEIVGEERGPSLTREEAILQANAYGEVAAQLYEMRKDSVRKSQKAYREGNHSVALYYSEMARWYMDRIEKSNSMAAKAILTGYEGWTTLDLHFLQVSEALNVLDLFVDEVIRVLQSSTRLKAVVFIITGRGLHSSGGRPRLKPAVQGRLSKRELRYSEQNPGMLKVTIPRTALISYMQNQDTKV